MTTKPIKGSLKQYEAPSVWIFTMSMESLLDGGSPIDTSGDPGNNQGGGGAGNGDQEDLGEGTAKALTLNDFVDFDAVDFVNEQNLSDWED